MIVVVYTLCCDLVWGELVAAVVSEDSLHRERKRVKHRLCVLSSCQALARDSFELTLVICHETQDIVCLIMINQWGQVLKKRSDKPSGYRLVIK